jgi:hypothetical protein
MSLIDAVLATGPIPSDAAIQAEKKRYSERLSRHLAEEVADGLRSVGFPNVKPLRGLPGEKEFQGGLGPKKVDVSYADERHGLLLAVSIKSINFAPFGKNLKNRFGDLCTEAITLHMRFPYSVVCMLFALPTASNEDVTRGRITSTFRRATRLFGTIGGRRDYTDPGEKFENVTMILFRPVTPSGPDPEVRLIDSQTEREISERDYYLNLRSIYNSRNPHALIEPDEALNDQNVEKDR